MISETKLLIIVVWVLTGSVIAGLVISTWIIKTFLMPQISVEAISACINKSENVLNVTVLIVNSGRVSGKLLNAYLEYGKISFEASYYYNVAKHVPLSLPAEIAPGNVTILIMFDLDDVPIKSSFLSLKLVLAERREIRIPITVQSC